MKKLIFAYALLAMFAGAAPLHAQDAENETGLPLPRFASLRSNNINARSGPGARYPIEWVYMQKSAPVEIIAEFELWRKIRDWQGSESWVHKSMLSGNRTVKVVAPGENNLYSKPDYNASVVAKVEDDVVGEIVACPSGNSFCEIKFDGVKGWLPRRDIFGLLPDEVLD